MTLKTVSSLVLLAGLLLASGCDRGPDDTWDLEILTPHHDQIQKEFERAFVAHVGHDVRIRWVQQGTAQIAKTLDATNRPDESFGFDLVFGGGVPDHDLFAAKGYLVKPNLPDGVLEAIPASVQGVSNVDDEGLWIGTALSSFGILVNRKGLDNQNLPPIEAWEDLAAPEMYSWVIVADPRKSSSVRVCYELVLQQYGWERGWALLMAMAGNARMVTPSSSQIPNKVASGDMLAGPCIDFYAWSRLAQQEDSGALEYVQGSAITPDPISLLRQPPHREMAERFIAFVVSDPGQRIWFLPPGAEGGPTENALYRRPVLPGLYEKYGDDTTMSNPYDEAGETYQNIDDQLQNRRTTLLAELYGATLVDLHDEVRMTWKALIDAGMPAEALAIWHEVPFSEAESLELSDQLAKAPTSRENRELVRTWTEQFHDRYRRVVELCSAR